MQPNKQTIKRGETRGSNNRLRDLGRLCQRCHVLHDVLHHTRQRWLTYRRRWAAGDLFLGPYAVGAMIQGIAR